MIPATYRQQHRCQPHPPKSTVVGLSPQNTTSEVASARGCFPPLRSGGGAREASGGGQVLAQFTATVFHRTVFLPCPTHQLGAISPIPAPKASAGSHAAPN